MWKFQRTIKCEFSYVKGFRRFLIKIKRLTTIKRYINRKNKKGKTRTFRIIWKFKNAKLSLRRYYWKIKNANQRAWRALLDSYLWIRIEIWRFETNTRERNKFSLTRSKINEILRIKFFKNWIARNRWKCWK